MGVAAKVRHTISAERATRGPRWVVKSRRSAGTWDGKGALGSGEGQGESVGAPHGDIPEKLPHEVLVGGSRVHQGGAMVVQIDPLAEGGRCMPEQLRGML
jgi:hypothetical protein